ncbi:MAG: 4-hydroxy-3-methylbut-2-enyl diphosphate reductase [Candidatus Aminicenantes bacterium]|nr:4-hydroxy-3-methylbut-2-enyl diphosphate reductase [Candidatus Aminicenantes bacterium]
MEIIVAKNSGLCYGVRRALDIAAETRQKKAGKVFTLGDLIHNPQVIADLERQRIHSINDLGGINKATVIIRSHGVSPDIYRSLAKKNIKIVDATCPIVKKIQKLVEVLAKEKEEIIIVGNKEHPEIKGLIGFSQGKGIIVENEDQVKSLPNRKKRAVLAQSTQDLYLFEKIVAALIEKTKELKVYNTICRSTQTRQKSTSELASYVDTLFIVGGKNSSNTNKLYQISKRILPNTYFIESAAQIKPEMLKGAKQIGLSGGASTPPKAIQEAVAKIRASFKHQFHREKTVQCQR